MEGEAEGAEAEGTEGTEAEGNEAEEASGRIWSGAVRVRSRARWVVAGGWRGGEGGGVEDMGGREERRG